MPNRPKRSCSSRAEEPTEPAEPTFFDAADNKPPGAEDVVVVDPCPLLDPTAPLLPCLDAPLGPEVGVDVAPELSEEEVGGLFSDAKIPDPVPAFVA